MVPVDGLLAPGRAGRNFRGSPGCDSPPTAQSSYQPLRPLHDKVAEPGGRADDFVKLTGLGIFGNGH